MAFKVITTGDYYLRSTVWTSDPERAQQFNSAEEARAQLLKAKQFMKASAYKAARIIEETA